MSEQFWARVAGNTDVPHHPVIARLLQDRDGTIWYQSLLKIRPGVDRMHLDQVHMICSQPIERLPDLIQDITLAPAINLRGQKHFIPSSPLDLANVRLAPLVHHSS